MLTTRDVMRELDVSRAWINDHIRHLGKARIPGNVSIFYNEEDIVEWFNENAQFDRQTYFLDFCDYMPQEKAAYVAGILDSEPQKTEWDKMKYRETVQKVLSEFISKDAGAYSRMIAERDRGNTPWIPVNHKITHLKQLTTMKKMKDRVGPNSSELIYRELYMGGRIRCRVKGRTFFTSVARPKYCILMPECFKYSK